MKLLIAGSDETWALEKFYCKHLSDAGVDITVVPVQSIFYSYYNKHLINKLLFKAGLSRIEQRIARRLKTVVAEKKPDAVWVFKGMEVLPGVLHWIKDKGVALVNYNPDNPFVFSGSGSGNANITRSIGIYDMHFTYDRDIQQRIKKEYKIPCKILPFGFELRNELYEECRKQQEVLKLCFLGNPDKQRADFVTALAEMMDIDVYGEGWKGFIQHPRVAVYPAVYGDEYWKTLHRYRVQLNLMRPHNLHSHNMRSFEVPGAGGIGLFPRTSDHSWFFEEGKEIFLYNDLAECIEKANLLLGMSSGMIENIRAAARKKSLQAGYTYKDRALQALTEIRNLVA
jgi:spore maturation protein CgeB